MTHRMRTLSVQTVVIVLVFALLVGCGDPATQRQRYLETGNKYFKNNKFKEASIMYRKALQKDMRFGEAYYRLGLTELKLGRVVDAMRALQRAVELDPKNIDAPARLAEIYLAIYASDPRKPQQFIREIEDLAKRLNDKDPNSYDGLRLNGYIALTKQNTEAALGFFEKANQVKPFQPETVLVLVQTLAVTKRWDEAESLAKQMIAKDKTYAPMYDVLYAKYAQDKREDEAEAILTQKMENNPKTAPFVQQVAAHHFLKGNRQKMQGALKRILDNPTDFPMRHYLVGEFYFRIRELDTAISQFEAGMKDQPKEKATYQKRIIETLVMQGKKTEAMQMVESLLKEDPKDNEAIAMRASLMLQSGTKEQIQAAVTDLQSVVARSPENPVLRFNLARALLGKNDLDAAKVQLQEAIKQRPDYTIAKLALSQVQIAKGEYSNAVQTANQILQFEGGNVAARLLKTSALIGMKEFGQARTELSDILERNPTLPDAQYQLAMVAKAEGRIKESEESFRSFYKNSPTDPRALPGLVETIMMQGRGEQAMDLMRAEVAKAPDRNDLRLIYANAAAAAKRYDVSETEFRALIEKNPKSSDLHLRLGHVLFEKQDFQGAMNEFDRAKDISPGDPAPWVMKAQVFERQGKTSEAMPVYQQIMKLDPENPIALNNVAFLMAEDGKDLDQALNLATRAKQKMPNHPDVNDTLGWIYIKKNLSDNAIMIFRDLTSKYPERAVFHYHLGMALYQKGDKTQAKRVLETALAKNPEKDDEGKIRELLAKI